MSFIMYLSRQYSLTGLNALDICCPNKLSYLLCLILSGVHKQPSLTLTNTRNPEQILRTDIQIFVRAGIKPFETPGSSLHSVNKFL